MSIRRLEMFIAAASLAATTLIAAPPAQAVPPPVANVSLRAGNQSEAASATDPSNPQNVVIVANNEPGGLVLGVTHDAGATWRRRVIGDGGTFGHACCDPTLSWDASGNLFLVWLDENDFSAIPVALSTDAGDHWTVITVLHPKPRPHLAGGAAVPIRTVSGEGDGDGRPKGSVDQPTVTTGHHAVWIVWNNRGAMQAAGAHIRALGDIGAFHKREDVPNTKGCSFGDVAVSRTGIVMQVCTKDRKTSPVTAKIRVNNDPDGLGPKGFGVGRTVGITNVEQFDAIPPQRDRTVDAETGLAWDRSGGAFEGRVTMIYTDEPANESGNTDVFSMSSDDAGKTWSAPVRVNAVTTRAQFLPKIAIDQQGNGELAASWHDARADDGNGGGGDTDGKPNTDAGYVIAFSTDGGASWTPGVAVSDGVSNARDAGNGIDFGDYTGLSFAGGAAWPAWADNSNSTGDNPDGALSTFDIYTRERFG